MLVHVRGAETHSLHLGQTLVTSLTGVEDHENDGRADRLVDQHLRHDRLHRGADEAAVQPLVPERGSASASVDTNPNKLESPHYVPVEKE